MKIKILSIVYTILSVSFLILLSIFKESEEIFISFFAYAFILFVQYRTLFFREKAFLNFITAHPSLNYVMLCLGFFYYLIIGILLVNDVVKVPFGYFVLTGCASACFYTFFLCKKCIDE